MDVKSETAELFNVNTLASTQIVVKISDESSPNDLHLTDRNSLDVRRERKKWVRFELKLSTLNVWESFAIG